MKKIWIKNATILTMENEELIYKSNLYIQGNTIYHVGDKLSDFDANKIIDANNNLVMPGLINAHTHVAMTLFRNMADDLNLEDWLFNVIFPLEDKLDRKDIYNGAKLGIAEMIASGTTSFVDMYFFEEQTARAALEMKIRGFVGHGIGSNKLESRYQRSLDLLNEFKDKNDNLITPIVAPHAIYTNTKESLKATKELKNKFQTLLTIHLNESQNELKSVQEKFNASPFEVAHEANLLDENTIVAHATHLNEKDIQIIKNTKVSLVHNPVSNLKLSSGIMDVQNLLNQGINIALGTDGAASNNILDMFESMKFASLLAKIKNYKPTDLKAFQVLQMATTNGAKAVGMENKLGKLKKDYLADLIIVDINNFNHFPQNNLINSLVYSTSSKDVITTIINGEIVYDNKQILIESFNYPKLKEEINQTLERIQESN
ncbi:amidohydrolase [Mycoplasmopsis gallopavonis]|uniref:5-methylthioadenosine/S-adenosylhomocysteine deaminase n=1 Tax=Mycoplasmopsis gallopavonis TaxID=76629 RepID=A0A449AZC1_9BACT|nr:amidohydrolase [Mycoplasmopsis gallopavonis]RIV16827.1 amidohydrolase [Mycoplasmopsis gallopavonis]VEU72806.1 5-methylthioadenosine/S-adenosylhomocysteine deaminase [Mycoplasmopsis gallopavonis]